MRKIGIGIISLLMVLTFASVGFGATNKETATTYKDKNNQEIVVTVEADVINKINEDIIQKIIDQNTELDGFSNSITIHNVDYGNHDNSDNGGTAGLMSTTVTKKFTARVNGPATFLPSVANGQTKQLGTTISVSNSKSFSAESGVSLPSGVSSKVSSSLTNSKTKTYTSTVTFNGPPSSSKAISRQYYNTPFSDIGTWTAKYKTLLGSEKTYTGTYKEPSSQDPFVEWSRDLY